MAKATVVIHRDVADVFDFLAKPRNLLDAAWGGRWQTDSLDQIGLGSRITGSKQHRPFKLTLDFLVTDFYRPSRLALRVSVPPYRSPVKLFLGRKKMQDSEDIWELERVAEGTRLTRVFSMPGKWLPSFGLRRDLRNVKARLESE